MGYEVLHPVHQREGEEIVTVDKLQKNQEIVLDIIGMTSEGNGVGKTSGGFAVFVPETAVGDQVLVRVAKVLKSYAFGILLEILQASPDRTEPECSVYRRCGGCSFRHISYEAELRIKEDFVRENLRKIAGIEMPLEPIESSPMRRGYRNKAQYPIQQGENGRVKIGFYAKRSHRVIESGGCDLQPGFFGEIVDTVRDFIEEYSISVYNEDTHKGLLRHLFIRYGEASGEIMVCFVVNGSSLPHAGQLTSLLLSRFPGVKSIILNQNTAKTNVITGQKNQILWGESFITDELCGLKFKLSPLSFYQVNRSGAEKLYGIAAEFGELTGKEDLLDLYCGTGTIGLSMADQAERVIGIEIIEDAVRDAKQNAVMNGITNADFLCGDASVAADYLEKHMLRPDVVVLDPPRKGCSPEALQSVLRIAPEKIVMISCNSATMARDVKILCTAGYGVKRVRPVDLFPRTTHVETVVLMSRKEG